ncbi:hypothetical protein HMI54_000536 [Coelomomyces lativittatus]|nr:hypothetical protein HMI56_006041 [Coelomomyces lativittatus]KAJ1511774.1 hypothetical protein HMI54_000536 [Coelomomyces lativittatus]
MESKADKVTVYDRQIRLWGIEAQSRLEHSRIVIAGTLELLASEVIKNLALAGVGEITLIANTKVTEQDIHRNFLISETQLGNYHSKVLQESVSELNPFVKVHSIQKSFDKIQETDPLWKVTDLLVFLEGEALDIEYKSE